MKAARPASMLQNGHLVKQDPPLIVGSLAARGEGEPPQQEGRVSHLVRGFVTHTDSRASDAANAACPCRSEQRCVSMQGQDDVGSSPAGPPLGGRPAAMYHQECKQRLATQHQHSTPAADSHAVCHGRHLFCFARAPCLLCTATRSTPCTRGMCSPRQEASCLRCPSLRSKFTWPTPTNLGKWRA